MRSDREQGAGRWLLLIGALGAVATAILIFALNEAGAVLGSVPAGAASVALLRRRGRGWRRSLLVGIGLSAAVAVLAVVAIFVFAVAICFSDLDRCFPS